jgi:predicted house-cleaning noncanonical NTP pyrophosphatase (MazG superfamily)
LEIKEMLENYNNYLAEIKTKEYAIKKLEVEEISISGSNFAINGDIKPKGYMTSNIEGKVINNTDEIVKLKKEVEELKDKIEIVNRIMNTLKYNDKQLIKMYFIEKKNAKILASILNREETSIYNSISRILRKMNKVYKSE